MKQTACPQGVLPEPMCDAVAARPLTPAMRPDRSRNNAAERPINKPPVSAVNGARGGIGPLSKSVLKIRLHCLWDWHQALIEVVGVVFRAHHLMQRHFARPVIDFVML